MRGTFRNIKIEKADKKFEVFKNQQREVRIDFKKRTLKKKKLFAQTFSMTGFIFVIVSTKFVSLDSKCSADIGRIKKRKKINIREKKNSQEV